MCTGVSPKRIATRNIAICSYSLSATLIVRATSSNSHLDLRSICEIASAHMPDSLYPQTASILAVCSYSLSAALTPWWLNRKTTSTFSSLERRWSSRTFRYGYLVTTSPQLSNLPSAAPSCVRSPTSGIFDSHGVTGGVYKTRERIHRSILICDY